MKKIKKIHFVGIKGVGMTPLALIAKESGIQVTGSDLPEKFITDEELEKAGIKILEGFKKDNLDDPDLLIFTAAHGGRDNVEVQFAIEKGIPVLNQGQALGKFQSGEIVDRNLKGISVAGSHGKTTTTAMLVNLFKESNRDPSYVIGSGETPSIGLSGYAGKGEYFINEADEYFSDVEYDKKPKFLYQKPEALLITNLDYDHPDIYESYDDLEKRYLEFVGLLPENGVLVVCGDGEMNRRFISKVKRDVVTFGLSPDNDFILEKINMNPEKMFFSVKTKETSLGQFSIGTFGEHNAKNALGALVTALELGLPIEGMRTGLSKYVGTKRRLERVGELVNGGFLFDDYAHHPLEVKSCISAFKKAFPDYNLVVIFQPHMYSRTKKFFDDFVVSFTSADEVIITEIFSSFREASDEKFSSKLIVDKLKNLGKNALYFNDKVDVIKYISSQKYPRKTIVVTMGAGDIYRIGDKIIDG